MGSADQANWERIGEVLGTRSKAEWIAAFDAGGVPVGPVHSIGEALSHPQTLARGMVVDLVHPQADRPSRLDARCTFQQHRRRSRGRHRCWANHAHTAARLRVQRRGNRRLRC